MPTPTSPLCDSLLHTRFTKLAAPFASERNKAWRRRSEWITGKFSEVYVRLGLR